MKYRIVFWALMSLLYVGVTLLCWRSTLAMLAYGWYNTDILTFAFGLFSLLVALLLTASIGFYLSVGLDVMGARMKTGSKP